MGAGVCTGFMTVIAIAKGCNRIMADARDFSQQADDAIADVFRLYVGQGNRFSYGSLSDVTGIPLSTLKSYAGGTAMPWTAMLRLIAVLPTEAGNMLIRPTGYKLAPIDPEQDDWDGIGAEASLLTFEIFDAQKDGKIDHREKARLQTRCKSLIAKAEGVLG